MVFFGKEVSKNFPNLRWQGGRSQRATFSAPTLLYAAKSSQNVILAQDTQQASVIRLVEHGQVACIGMLSEQVKHFGERLLRKGD